MDIPVDLVIDINLSLDHNCIYQKNSKLLEYDHHITVLFSIRFESMEYPMYQIHDYHSQQKNFQHL